MEAIKVMILDDDACIRKLLVKYCQEFGYDVVSYSEPLNCPSYLRQKCECSRNYSCSDIIITDINMPNMSGLDFLKHQLKNNCRGLIHHKAVMSGDISKEQEEQARQMGCAIFTKPFDLEEIGNWLKQCEQSIRKQREGEK